MLRLFGEQLAKTNGKSKKKNLFYVRSPFTTTSRTVVLGFHRASQKDYDLHAAKPHPGS